MSESIEQLIAKAGEGDADAQYELGWRYIDADGVDQDYEKAFYWSQKAVDAGHIKAINNVASMYKDGNGVEKNQEKAFELYSMGC
jgi:TPR repeat protein